MARELSPRALSIARWLELLSYAVVAAACITLSLPRLLDITGAFLERWHLAVWSVSASTILLTTMLVLSGRGNWPTFLGLRHFVAYPPTWVSCAIGASLCFLGWWFVPESWAAVGGSTAERSELFFASLLGLIPVALAYLGERSLSTGRAPKSSRNHASRSAVVPTDLIQWLMSDAAITAPGTDRFGHTRIAHRIVKRIRDDREDTTVALIGSLGSGKTSIGLLVKHELDRAITAGIVTRFVAISVWYYENAEAAVSGIIGALLDSLADEVNSIALTGLAGSYVDVIDGVNDVWGSLLRRLGSQKSPEETLRAFDRVATASRLRFVLWVEDLERFSGSTSDVSSVDERVSSIRALLYLLHRLESVTVVLTSTTLAARFDVEKIARYVEQIPRVDSVLCAAVLFNFRQRCLAELGSMIDPASPRGRKELDLSEEQLHDHHWFDGRMPSSVHSIASALIVMCSTPRRIKFALRDSHDKWMNLRGNIDFDELLAMSVLKEAHPDVFALVDSYFSVLRTGDRIFSAHGRDEPSNFRLKLDQTTNLLSDREKNAVRKVLEFVFGGLDRPGPRASDRPQGLAVVAHADYWRRFLAGGELNEHESDQAVLSAIYNEQVQAIREFLEHSTLHAAVELFGRRLSGEVLVRVFEDLVEVNLTRSPESWADDGFGKPSPQGLVPLWRMMSAAIEADRLRRDEVIPVLRDALERAVADNLVLADELEHWFIVADEKKEPERSIAGEHGPELRRNVRRKLRAYYGTNPRLLCDRLFVAPSYLLWRLCWGLDRVRSSDFAGVPFDDWPDFASAVLAACEIRPDVMLPQVARMLVTSSDMSDGKTVYSYDRSLSDRLFGHEQIAKIFRSREESSDDCVRAVRTGVETP